MKHKLAPRCCRAQNTAIFSFRKILISVPILLKRIYEKPIKMPASKAKTKDYDKRPVNVIAEIVAAHF